jgi:hypothetical protein
MRGVSLGRKNWLQIGSERAGPKVAALLSVLESCKPPRVNVGEYLLGDCRNFPTLPASLVARQASDGGPHVGGMESRTTWPDSRKMDM